MNDPVAFVVGCIFIGVGFATGLSCIGDGIKNYVKYLEKKALTKP